MAAPLQSSPYKTGIIGRSVWINFEVSEFLFNEKSVSVDRFFIKTKGNSYPVSSVSGVSKTKRVQYIIIFIAFYNILALPLTISKSLLIGLAIFFAVWILSALLIPKIYVVSLKMSPKDAVILKTKDEAQAIRLQTAIENAIQVERSSQSR